MLKSVTESAHVSIYRGKKVAVDGYVWLHRGAFCCARELCEGRPTDKCAAACVVVLHFFVSFRGLSVPTPRRYVTYFVKNIEVLRSAGVTPVIIFVRSFASEVGNAMQHVSACCVRVGDEALHRPAGWWQASEQVRRGG